MAEDATTEEILTTNTEPINLVTDEPSEPEIKKFDALEARIEYTLEQNARGVDLQEIAVVVDRSVPTIYQWISDAKESRPLVPQGRQLANAG
ncbi:hypothetical protein [Rhodococcus qingshengii]|uniref:Uncharacterized protein n=1 Tax=Rhodococcus qingshengii TaxID=334542 RepID=A0A2A5J0T2_RHOSG|nr:hypothetical protein [Rhodococcus qingshengii]PCK23194.1 hypothetical protein CHR55_30730 [Rhodococcus qingshengii]